MKRIWWVVTLVAALAMVPLLVSCKGATGDIGAVGAPGTSVGTLNGVITNSLTKSPLAGATVTTDPVVQGVTITSGSDGSYSAGLPIGTYKVTVANVNFTSFSSNVTLVAGQTVTSNVALKPVAPVKVDAGAAQTASPGESVNLKVTATPYDGSTVTAYKWSQAAGPKATISNGTTDTVSVALADAATYKAAMMAGLTLLDRVQVEAINPEAPIKAKATTFKVTVSTTSGNYTGTVTVTGNMPYAFATTGLQDVPVGVPVLLSGKANGPYKWSISGPAGSTATLDSPTDRNPSFTPDVAGKYTLLEATSKVSLGVYAGTWSGAITGQDSNGNPVAAKCTVCHNGKIAPDNFTAWSQSGHAQIFTYNLTTSTHYGESCFSCHTVGFDKSTAAVNGGIDDAPDYAAFSAAGLLGKGISTAWITTLAQFPKTAQLANIQCENCHGPNDGTGLHANASSLTAQIAGSKIDPARISLSADVCGACHGEPPSHGLYQQWQLSKHGDFSVAISESTNTNCARCHTAQGFLTWLQQGQTDLTKSLQGANGTANATEMAAIVTPDTAQPQTCVTCHDPHDVGPSATSTPDGHVRITDNTPMLPSGYQATNVGKGAICITCHNTRNGAHNDANPPTSYSAPHTAAQGDVLMGQNAYFVGVPSRSPHASLQDSCVTCHMEKSPQPADLSKPGSGTNHTFAASIDICKDCHSTSLNGEAFQSGYAAKIKALAAQMGTYLLNKIPAQVSIKDYTAHINGGKSYDMASDYQVITKDNIASVNLTSIHGQEGFSLVFKNPVTFTYTVAGEGPHIMTIGQAQFQLGSISADGGKTVLFGLTDNLVKAGWNYFLIANDSSLGVHNPAFESQVLDATISALK